VYALTVQPLSVAHRERFEAAVGRRPTYLTLAQLRRLGNRGMLSRLRSLRGQHVFLVVEDASGEPVIPVLQALAAAALPSSIELVDPELRRRAVRRRHASAAVASVAAASARSAIATAGARRELGALTTQARVEARPGREKRVLYLNGNLWFGVKVGGSVGHVAGVVNGLSAAGYDVDIASLYEPLLVDPSTRFVPLEPPSTLGFPFENNVYRFNAKMVRQLRSEVASSSYRFIYQRLSMGNYAGTLLSRSTRLPLVIEYNGSEAWVARNWGRPLRNHELAVLAEEACLRHAHLVVTVSEPLRDELLERGVEERRIVCYPNCVDPDRFDPVAHPRSEQEATRRSIGVSTEATVVTFVGTFGQWHGVEVLARAIRELVEHDEAWLIRRDVHFLIVGDGVKGDEVRAILEGCERFCSMIGLVAQDRAPALLAASDVVVSPHVPNADGSPFFGSPTKLFEYMAMGRPVVASDLDQIGDVLHPALRSSSLPDAAPSPDDARLAVLCAPGDVSDLARGIKFLVERQDWRAQLGSRAREKVLSTFTWDHHVGAVLAGADSVLAGTFSQTASSSSSRARN